MLRHLIALLFLSSSCVTIELLNLPEGSTCMRNNVSGKCVSIYNCLSSYIDHVNKNNAPICSLRGKEPILCCTDCTFNDTRSMVIDPNVGIIHKTGNRVQDKCIENIQRLDYSCKRIYNATMLRVYKPDANCHEVKINIEALGGGGSAVGGTDARRDEFPHMTWRDPKKKARADGAKVNSARAVTGNNTAIPSLSTTSTKILNIIGTESAYGMAGQQETELGEIVPPPPATSPPPVISPPPATSPPASLFTTPLETTPSTSTNPGPSVPTIVPPSTPSTQQASARGQRARSLRNDFLVSDSETRCVLQALLGYGDDVRTADWLCGGSVISERFILTAGHCLSSVSSGLVNFVTLGILKRSDPPELWQIYNVKRRIPHPEYKPPSKYHDIALLETDIEIIYSRQVLPACLHAAGEPGEYNSTALGWGALGYKRKLADILQTVPVSRYEKDECFKYYPRHRHLKNGFNHTTQMCYGDKKVLRDTCEGDSGGPLQYKRNDYSVRLSCIYTIIGVTSSGSQCGIAPSPGIYTRVIHYVPWIESIVWP